MTDSVRNSRVLTIAEIKKTVQKVLRRKQFVGKVKSVAVFGSHARGTATMKSDVDLLVDLERSAGVTLFDLGGMLADLQDALKKKVDFVPRDRLRPHVRSSALRNQIEIFKK